VATAEALRDGSTASIGRSKAETELELRLVLESTVRRGATTFVRDAGASSSGSRVWAETNASATPRVATGILTALSLPPPDRSGESFLAAGESKRDSGPSRDVTPCVSMLGSEPLVSLGLAERSFVPG
jgi:hypothetical protein